MGDAEFQKKCLGKMGEVAEGGRTVLFVSHNMGAVQLLTKRCIFFDLGTIVEQGPTGDVINLYIASVESDTDNDFSKAERIDSDYGKMIRICRISPNTQNDVAFYFGQDILFEVELVSEKKYKNLRFGITISDISGIPILSTFSSNSVVVLGKGNLNREKFSVTINNVDLAPGKYSVALSIGKGGVSDARINYDVINPGPIFSVASFTKGGKSIFKWNKTYGWIYHEGCVVTKLIM